MICDEFTRDIITSNGTNLTDFEPCTYTHDGSGVLYQTLAGPVFNTVYPLTGILVGILADIYNRKILLAISLAFWSIATGLTGFATEYWMLVVFRMLLAIG